MRMMTNVNGLSDFSGDTPTCTKDSDTHVSMDRLVLREVVGCDLCVEFVS